MQRRGYEETVPWHYSGARPFGSEKAYLIVKNKKWISCQRVAFSPLHPIIPSTILRTRTVTGEYRLRSQAEGVPETSTILARFSLLGVRGGIAGLREHMDIRRLRGQSYYGSRGSCSKLARVSSYKPKPVGDDMREGYTNERPRRDPDALEESLAAIASLPKTHQPRTVVETYIRKDEKYRDFVTGEAFFCGFSPVEMQEWCHGSTLSPHKTSPCNAAAMRSVHEGCSRKQSKHMLLSMPGETFRPRNSYIHRQKMKIFFDSYRSFSSDGGEWRAAPQLPDIVYAKD
ncbi:hypothetical protein IW262DRAFT_1297591 [Armillaria fumosa]|nr:hypothetical protein IW262DRAFT_1297591 [Armillaria fumosa]